MRTLLLGTELKCLKLKSFFYPFYEIFFSFILVLFNHTICDLSIAKHPLLSFCYNWRMGAGGGVLTIFLCLFARIVYRTSLQNIQIFTKNGLQYLHVR